MAIKAEFKEFITAPQLHAPVPAQPPETKQSFEIGILKSIRFQNDSGFLIGIFENQQSTKRWGNTFSGLGSIMNPEPGLAYKLFGKWEANGQWGDQYKFQFYELMQPTDTKGIYQYLVRVCKWVGPTVASRIVEKYGTDALAILKNDPARVAKEIHGITEVRAIEIQQKLRGNEHVEKVLVEIERIFAPIAGLRKNLPMELVKLWGSDALEKLKSNPYMLTRLKNVGFPTADKVAIAMGFDRKSKFRQSAAVWHLLNENMNANGSVWMAGKMLVDGVKELTGLSEADDGGVGIDGCLADMAAEGVVVENRGAWAVTAADKDETYIASKVARMINHDQP